MKFRWPWQKKNENELDSFAKELEALYQPVKPRDEFVRDLRDNLLKRPKPAWLPLPKMGWQLILLIGGGLISLVLVVLGGIQFVANLLSRKKSNSDDGADSLPLEDSPPSSAEETSS